MTEITPLYLVGNQTMNNIDITTLRSGNGKTTKKGYTNEKGMQVLGTDGRKGEDKNKTKTQYLCECTTCSTRQWVNHTSTHEVWCRTPECMTAEHKRSAANRKQAERDRMTAAGYVRSSARWIHADDKAEIDALIDQLNANRGI